MAFAILSGFSAFYRDIPVIDFIGAIPYNKKQPYQGRSAYLQTTDNAESEPGGDLFHHPRLCRQRPKSGRRGGELRHGAGVP